MRLGRLAGHVPAHVHRVQQLLLRLVHLVGGYVEIGWRDGAVERFGKYFVMSWHLKGKVFQCVRCLGNKFGRYSIGEARYCGI